MSPTPRCRAISDGRCGAGIAAADAVTAETETEKQGAAGSSPSCLQRWLPAQHAFRRIDGLATSGAAAARRAGPAEASRSPVGDHPAATPRQMAQEALCIRPSYVWPCPEPGAEGSACRDDGWTLDAQGALGALPIGVRARPECSPSHARRSHTPGVAVQAWLTPACELAGAVERCLTALCSGCGPQGAAVAVAAARLLADALAPSQLVDQEQGELVSCGAALSAARNVFPGGQAQVQGASRARVQQSSRHARGARAPHGTPCTLT